MAVFEKLISYELRINHTPVNTPIYRGNNTYNSVLNDENIFKIAVTETGIHKMDYSFLKNELEVNIDGVAIENIKMYGNGGGVVPQENSLERPDDLIENAIEIVDANGNNQFDNGDYILFFGEASSKWIFNKSSRQFRFQSNPYDYNNYYFLKIGSDKGERLQSQSSLTNTAYTSKGFNDLVHFEEDKINVLSRKFNPNTQGTGKQWFGDRFEALREKDYNTQFSFPNIILSDSVEFKVSFAGRSDVKTSYQFIADGQPYTSTEISRTNTTDIESRFAYLRSINKKIRCSK